MIAITPKTSPANNPKTQQPYVAVGYTVDYRVVAGAMQSARPTFYDVGGAVLPAGAIPLVLASGQTVAQAQAAESGMIAIAASENPAAPVDSVAAPVLAITRGVSTSSPSVTKK